MGGDRREVTRLCACAAYVWGSKGSFALPRLLVLVVAVLAVALAAIAKRAHSSTTGNALAGLDGQLAGSAIRQ